VLRALAVLLVLAAACRWTQAPDPEPASDPPVAAAPSPASATPAATSAARPVPSEPARAQLQASFEPQAGGRTLTWWGERLTTLRRDGPPELYELALQRARTNGLKVNLDGETIGVESGDGGGKP
jgi:hypothetical protein